MLPSYRAIQTNQTSRDVSSSKYGFDAKIISDFKVLVSRETFSDCVIAEEIYCVMIFFKDLKGEKQ